MASNVAANFSADIVNFIEKKTLTLAKRQLTAYQFGTKLRLPKNMGTTYTATRYSRLPLPAAPLAEGVPSAGESMTISQSQGTAQQWGDSVQLTDVAELTIHHDVFKKAIDLVVTQVAETFERNAYTGTNGLMAGTNVNYAGAATTRAGLSSSNVMTPHEINLSVGTLNTIGAPKFGEPKKDSYEVSAAALKGTVNPHYVAILHPLVAQDLRENSTVLTAWSYSDVNRIYTYELGEWGGVRFTQSNMVPSWTGVAAVTGTPATTGGTLATGTYYIQLVGSTVQQDGTNVRVHQVSAGISVTGPTGSITLTTPNVPGYVYEVYIGTTAAPVNLAAGTGGPTTGPLAGQVATVPANTAVTLTAVGSAEVPEAPPATGVTVFPTFVLGKDAYGVVELDSLKTEYLDQADKLDRHNQLRVVAWKVFYGMIILNQAFFMRIESGSAFAANYDSGAVNGVTF